MAKKEKKEKSNLDNMSALELGKLVLDLKEEIRKARFDKALGLSTNQTLIASTKKKIAKVMTLAKQKS